MSASAAWLPEGRLHLHHGPIDLIVTIEGLGRDDGMRRAWARFETILEDLVAELPRLRRADGPRPMPPPLSPRWPPSPARSPTKS